MQKAVPARLAGTSMTTLSIGLSVALSAAATTAHADPQRIDYWRTEASHTEVSAQQEAIDRFNRAQSHWHVEMSRLPAGSYTEAVTAAALAGDLPCVLYIDQPVAPNFAWSGFLRPLDDLIAPETLAPLLETAKATYNGKVYAAGQNEEVLVLYGRRSVIEAHGIRIATLDAPWGQTEFLAALETLKQSGDFLYPLDIQAGWTGDEWYSYAFGPWLLSFGADQIDRDSYLEAEGVLNGGAAEAWGEFFQGLFEAGYVDRNPSDNRGFDQGRVALNYVGSWELRNHLAAWGDDLVVMPVPDFGHGPLIGGGSWQLGISTQCNAPEGAAEFVEFLLQPEEIAETSKARITVPSHPQAAALTEDFREGGRWRFFYDYAEAHARLRPATPGYPTISSAFERATRDIRDGRDVLTALDEAVDAIERDIADNRGYGFHE
ncbi:extracellular solute-binding protein [Halomonas sp. BM-2019]|uniref:ABC transporter substrate-binding protein n=1 Tax=Halomonas sp. BM-2019 TaxID=2811227 RepID=UPI001B3C2B4F|nr:MAG: extracellular solute-binding protein [Halomonas sp. BM-2019]